MSKRDYYEVLGVERGINDRDLKKAYRRIAQKYHPDRNSDDADAEEHFKEAKNVSARDKATGKEQSIVIKASLGLSDDEIESMVRDAESHAEEDRKARELIDVRNAADNTIHAKSNGHQCRFNE